MEKGFTLVELLAVIIIVGIISVIAIPPIMKTVNDSRNAAYDQLISNIENATQLYIRNNKDDIEGSTVVGTEIEIPLEDLVDSGDLKEPIIDPTNDSQISLSSTVTVFVESRGRYRVVVNDFIYN